MRRRHIYRLKQEDCFNSRTLGRVRHLFSTAPSVASFVSIHAPWEGCDIEHVVISNPASSVSIHAPWEGCDFTARLPPKGGGCFNSRTLGRVRPPKELPYLPRPQVSIHAPWEGCDGLGVSITHQLHISFNSRTLGRVRLLVNPFRLLAYQFQFTHPGKGATAYCPSHSKS